MNMLVKKIALTCFLVITMISQPFIISANEDSLNIKNETINPGSIYYSFKRLWEKGSAKLQFSSQSKIRFNESLLKTRLAELNYVVQNKLLSEVQSSSERFAYQAGILTKGLSKGNKEKEKIVKEFEQIQIFLDKLRDNYPANSSFWMLIQHDINTLKILADQIK